MTNQRDTSADAVIVGSGPAGLSAAIELRKLGVKRVMVIERELQAGGVPRHCDHTGFALRDLHRAMTGPRYSATLVCRAWDAGVELLVGTTVTEIRENQLLQLTSRNGVDHIQARAILIASGARERPRSARLVPGDRPAGVFTTGQLQQWTFLKHHAVGTRAIIVGAENVSFSAMMTLRHAGAEIAAVTTELPRHQSLAAFAGVARYLYRIPLLTSTRVVAIFGKGRVREVVLESLESRRRWTESVDTVVFTGDWIPDNELSRRAGLEIDSGTLGPATDRGGRTSAPFIYAAGNVLHAVETADTAALRARDVARQMAIDLSAFTPAANRVELVVEAPLTWVWPNRISPGGDVARLALRASEFDPRRTLIATQNGRTLGTARIGRIIPNRSLSVSGKFVSNFDPRGGTIRINLHEQRN